MHVAILSHPESWYRRDLEGAARSRGHHVTGLPFSGLSSAMIDGSMRVDEAVGAGLKDFDAVIVRTMPPGSLEQVVFRMNLLAQWELRGVQVLNPARSVECAVDKYLTTARLQSAGLPVPRTVVCETAESALAAFAALGGDVVVKPLFGAEGRGILRVSDPDLALRVFRTLERIQAVLYLQEFIDHPGFDVRVMVLDGQVIGGMRRRNPGDFRTNVSRQAVAEPIELTEQQRDWAIRAADAVGTRIAGVDLLSSRAGAGYVIEVNGVPGWQAFQRVTGVPVAERVIASLERGPDQAR